MRFSIRPRTLRRLSPMAAAGIALTLIAGPALAASTSTSVDGTSYNSTTLVRHTTDSGKVLGPDRLRRNPCAGAIRYRVNVGVLPAAERDLAIADVKAAYAATASATGYSFIYDGTTTIIPQKGLASVPTAYMVVAWAMPAGHANGSDMLANNTTMLGQGTLAWGASFSNVNGVNYYHPPAITKGGVALSAKNNGPLVKGASTAKGVHRRALIMHEIAHTLGLNHVSDQQLLYYKLPINTSPGAWGAGDKAGLAKVGASQPCQAKRAY